MKQHSVVIKSVNPEFPISGRNCEITLDGKTLDGVAQIDFSLSPNTIGTLTIVLNADVRIEGILDVESSKSETRYDVVNSATKQKIGEVVL